MLCSVAQIEREYDADLRPAAAADPSGLDVLWSETEGDPRVCLAILDGPVDLRHPCFEGAQLSQLETVVPGAADGGPASQHGTHVASVVFGQPGTSVRGVAPGCRGLIIPIFKDANSESFAPASQLDLARAIALAVQHGAHVINISGGQFEPSGEAEPVLADAVRLCATSGVLIVAAVGNEGCACLHVPAALPAVLAVGAMDSEGRPLAFTNWGGPYQTQGVLAPGEGVLGALPGGGTALRTGTSFATPLVSGVAGLLLSLQVKQGEKPDPLAVRDSILKSAISCEEQPVSQCERLLAGRLNSIGALRHLKEGEKITMAEKITETGNPTPEVERVLAQDAEPQSSPAARPSSSAGEPTEKDEPERGVVAAAAPASPAVKEPAPPAPAPVETGQVTPSGCACGSGAPPQLVYALGQVGYDFGTEARRDSFIQHGIENPHDPTQILRHLSEHPSHATALLWTLVQETTPIYAVQPGSAFASQTYDRLREFLNAQLTEGVERVSIPGFIVGSTTLLNGQVVPVVVPELRGMYSWSTTALVKAVAGAAPTKKEDREKYDQKAQDIANFLERVYYEIRNLGVTSQERAMNYAATNAFQLEHVYRSAIEQGNKLDSIDVERSPICRPGSDCWDVKLTFFHPTKRLEQARVVYRFTVDVSDVVPVTVGKVRSWHVY